MYVSLESNSVDRFLRKKKLKTNQFGMPRKKKYMKRYKKKKKQCKKKIKM